LNVIAWIVWACFAVDYVARLLLSVEKARFVRTHKLDLLMVLLPMLRLLHIFLLPRHSLASVSTERIAGGPHGRARVRQRLLHVARGVQRARRNTRSAPDRGPSMSCPFDLIKAAAVHVAAAQPRGRKPSVIRYGTSQ
jgi:hypothetical protein